MKKVKIKFVGFWQGFQPEELLVYQIMKKHYDVEITDDADYIICSIFGAPYEYCKYPQPRIMCVGENYVPDFNLIDYSICRYPITYLDRNFYLPGCADDVSGHWMSLKDKDRNYSKKDLEEKTYFANFIAGHESEYNIRGDFFKKLCEYKRVESVGTYLNNMPDGKAVDFKNSSKTDFQRKCKFTLCFESTAHSGFVTEKIVDAFYADTIPVYYGNDHIGEIFNENAFIDCSKYASFDEAIAKIVELDSDDEKYLKMLREPIFTDAAYPKKLQQELEAYVCNIFDQPPQHAYRRSRVYHPKDMNDYLAEVRCYQDMPTKQKVFRWLKRKLHLK